MYALGLAISDITRALSLEWEHVNDPIPRMDHGDLRSHHPDVKKARLHQPKYLLNNWNQSHWLKVLQGFPLQFHQNDFSSSTPQSFNKKYSQSKWLLWMLTGISLFKTNSWRVTLQPNCEAFSTSGQSLPNQRNFCYRCPSPFFFLHLISESFLVSLVFH